MDTNGYTHVPATSAEPLTVASVLDRVTAFEAERQELVDDLLAERAGLLERAAAITSSLARLGYRESEETAQDDRAHGRRASGSVTGALLKCLEEHPGLSLSELTDKLGWSKDKARSILQAAKKNGTVTATGDRMHMQYYVT